MSKDPGSADRPLDREEVRRIAGLARLELSPEEEELFAHQLGRIVGYVDELKHFATAQSPAVADPAPEAADEPAPSLPRESFLAAAPCTLDGFLVVPQVKATPAGSASEESETESQ